ncbi:MAG: hypothetical protein ACYDBP_00135 [Leptospirales bacterium]
MDERTRFAVGILLRVYADIDILALELCADRLPFAPSAEARKELMDQIKEEVVHFTIQENTLSALGVPFSPVMTLAKRQEIKKWFSGLDWYGFLAGLQLGIEGIGIVIVEQVSLRAGTLIQESLKIPIADEMRQTSFGVREWKGLLAHCTEMEKAEHLERVLMIFEDLYHKTEAALPVKFEDHWAVLGLKKEDLWVRVRERTLHILETAGFEAALPLAFID